MTQGFDHLNMNNASSITPSASCEICGSVDHLTVNCQVGSLFNQDTSDQVNYVNNFNPRLPDNPFFNTYNMVWRNHPNFSYRSNP